MIVIIVLIPTNIFIQYIMHPSSSLPLFLSLSNQRKLSVIRRKKNDKKKECIIVFSDDKREKYF